MLQLRHIAKQKIDVQAALVGLVDDDGVIGAEEAVFMDFSQQHAVGHHLDAGALRYAIGKTDPPAHLLANFALQFFCNALRHRARRNATWLGTGNHAGHATPQRQANLGNLGGLARTGLAANDGDRMRSDGARNLLSRILDGQVTFEARMGQRGLAGTKPLLRAAQALLPLAGAVAVGRPCGVAPARPQPVPVLDQALIQQGLQVGGGRNDGRRGRRRAD